MIEGLRRVPLARHDHEHGQDGDDNPVSIYVPGLHLHGYGALTDALFGNPVAEEYTAADPDEHRVPWNDPRVRRLWRTEAPIVSTRDAG